MSRTVAICLCTLALFVGSAAVVLAAYDETLHRAQKALKERGYDHGVLNGLWGKKTVESIRKFQRGKGLPVSGKLDEKTKEGLGLLKELGIEAQQLERKPSKMTATTEDIKMLSRSILKKLDNILNVAQMDQV
jgi:peptidoglycan hydrolase-like protein with peptidoglycan-binding domain